MGPYQTDLVQADEFERIIAGLIKRPGMYVGVNNYHAVTAFIMGLDKGELVGLHQWLVVQLNGLNNVVWTASILELSKDPIPWPLESEEDHSKAIQLMGKTLTDFFEYRREAGLTKIFYDYANWLLARKSYDGPLREK